MGQLPNMYPYGNGNLKNKNNVTEGSEDDERIRKLSKID